MTAPVITAWSAVSPFGLGRGAFAAGVAAGTSAVTRPEEWPVPRQRVAPVPGFVTAEVLGRKGTRSMDRVSALTAAAADELLGAAGRHREVASGERAALVLGTTAGSSRSMMDITRDTHTRAMPFHIDTPRIPNAIMNSSAAQCAIRHNLKGPNATVAGGRAAGLFALRYALRLLSSGRARSVLCGGAEELTQDRAWLEHLAGDPDRPTALGEGCSLLLLEPAAPPDGPVLAEVLGVTLGVFREGERDTALTDCLSRALARAGVAAADLWAVSPAVGQTGVRLAGHAPLPLPGEESWGDAGAAAAPFQIASVLAAAERDPAARGRVAAVLSADRDNVLGCALFRIAKAARSDHA
ncbi:beta-ketoacyl synthase N-terminal-like domain-containing protein [Streptomyces echinatus]|uniref:3-oxoacyl-[acyl-carrier-protein] synthase II n=1 Tax=Streptomyces echinatus TaxID=67293 RepID=A0A7W9UQZ5_9ACTN|nr:beta-ketoacyl synthase N-terminal-like domain-containing protein [Streptomyces echinatus]MBB5927466.1 3-oxoacyl-[acyl-carrier-protein] synthase II [Streptomyces echinatus]